MVEEGPLCVFQTQISPKDLHEHTNPSLFMEDEKDEQLCNQSHTIEKPAVCHEELNRKEEDEGSQMDVSFCFPNSEIFCQEEIYLLDPIKEKDEISTNTHQENHFFYSENLNDILKRISACLHMMNMRMTTWIVHLKNRKSTIIDWIT